jgi:hypothetical protein
MNLLAIPSSRTFRARIRLFRFARGTTLIEIAVYSLCMQYTIPLQLSTNLLSRQERRNISLYKFGCKLYKFGCKLL